MRLDVNGGSGGVVTNSGGAGEEERSGRLTLPSPNVNNSFLHTPDSSGLQPQPTLTLTHIYGDVEDRRLEYPPSMNPPHNPDLNDNNNPTINNNVKNTRRHTSTSNDMMVVPEANMRYGIQVEPKARGRRKKVDTPETSYGGVGGWFQSPTQQQQHQTANNNNNANNVRNTPQSVRIAGLGIAVPISSPTSASSPQQPQPPLPVSPPTNARYPFRNVQADEQSETISDGSDLVTIMPPVPTASILMPSSSLAGSSMVPPPHLASSSSRASPGTAVTRGRRPMTAGGRAAPPATTTSSRLQHTPHPPPPSLASMSTSASHRTALVTILPTPVHQVMHSQVATRITSPVDDTTTSSTMPHHSSLTGSMTGSSVGIVTLHNTYSSHEDEDELLGGTTITGGDGGDNDLEDGELLTTEPSSSRSELNSHSPIRGVISVMSTRDSFRIQGMSQEAFSALRNSDSTLSADVLSSSSSSYSR
eukprot:TRINITY_DN18406_c0_g1_i17.p1 TRINITY_DN18406_c0_g1~~TRINITY_DN18406_c0_g1_i17.p1  ORF type:complete len:475 (+),score=74.65 TRINITY_DN18406_c0_g1_i17:195-1619(+)